MTQSKFSDVVQKIFTAEGNGRFSYQSYTFLDLVAAEDEIKGGHAMSGSTPVLVANIEKKWLDGVDVEEIGHITSVQKIDGINYIFCEVRLNEKVIWFVLPLIGKDYEGFWHDMKTLGFAVLLQNQWQTVRLLLKCYLDEEQTCEEHECTLPPSMHARSGLARKVLLVASERMLADQDGDIHTVLCLSDDFLRNIAFVTAAVNSMRP